MIISYHNIILSYRVKYAIPYYTAPHNIIVNIIPYGKKVKKKRRRSVWVLAIALLA